MISSTTANPFNITGFQSMITLGSDGNLWFTESGAIAILNPATGAIKQVPLPTTNGAQTPLAITAGPDGNIWFVGNGFRIVGRGCDQRGDPDVCPGVRCACSIPPEWHHRRAG